MDLSARLDGLHGAEELVHSGGTVTRRLPIVCGDTCNGGWMSRLERAVRPVVTPLMSDAPVALDAEQQRLLALWAKKTVMVMVNEYTDRNTMVSTQSQREWLRENQQPLAESLIMLGRYDGTNWLNRIRHTTARLSAPSVANEIVRIRSDVLVTGALLLFVWNSPREFWPNFSGHPMLRQVWPPEAEVVEFDKTIETIDDIEVVGLSDLLHDWGLRQGQWESESE